MVDGSSVLVADDVGVPRQRHVARRARRQHARHRRARTTTPTSAPTAATSRSARSSRSSTPSCWTGSASTPPNCPTRTTSARWPELRAMLTEAFAAHDRDHWAKVFAGTDACVTPVLSFGEVRDRAAHHRARHLLPRRRRRPAAAPGAAVLPQRARRPRRRRACPGADTEAVLRRTGYSPQPTSRSRANRKESHCGDQGRRSRRHRRRLGPRPGDHQAAAGRGAHRWW